MSTQAANRALVEHYWTLHYRRDWREAAAFYAVDIHYTDVGADPVGARGPAQVIARLSALDEPQDYEEIRQSLTAEGDRVVTEHIEILRFTSGEVVEYPFASVMEVRDGLIHRWHDYGDAALFTRGPADWLARAQDWRARLARS